MIRDQNLPKPSKTIRQALYRIPKRHRRAILEAAKSIVDKDRQTFSWGGQLVLEKSRGPADFLAAALAGEPDQMVRWAECAALDVARVIYWQGVEAGTITPVINGRLREVA